MIGIYVTQLTQPVLTRSAILLQQKKVTPDMLLAFMWFSAFLTLLACAFQVYPAAALAFLMHRLAISLRDIIAPQAATNAIKMALRDYALLMAVLFLMGMGYGLYMTPLAFLMWSWAVLALATLAMPAVRSLIGIFEMGVAVILMCLMPQYIPVVAILFGLACFVAVLYLFWRSWLDAQRATGD